MLSVAIARVAARSMSFARSSRAARALARWSGATWVYLPVVRTLGMSCPRKPAISSSGTPAGPHLGRNGVPDSVGGHVPPEASVVAQVLEGVRQVSYRSAAVGDECAGGRGLDPGPQERHHGQDRAPLLGLRPAGRVEVDRAPVEVALEAGQLQDRFGTGRRAEQQDQVHAEVLRHFHVPEPRQFGNGQHALAVRASGNEAKGMERSNSPFFQAWLTAALAMPIAPLIVAVP